MVEPPKETFTSKSSSGKPKKDKKEGKSDTTTNKLLDVQKKHEKILVPAGYPETPKLNVFDVDDPDNRLPKGFFLICEGSRRVGKSIFLKWLLYSYREDFDLVMVITETPQNGFWQPIVSNKYVHNGWDPFLIEELFRQQIEDVSKEKNSQSSNYKAKNVLVILDDIVGDRRRIHDDATLNKLSVQGRHYNISICITTQEPAAIGTALRNNCDMAIIFQQKSERAKKSVCMDFLNFKLPYEWQARDLLNTYTENHDSIAVKMHMLKKDPHLAYLHVPERLSYNSQTEKCTVPDYQMGSEEQKHFAKTKAGKLPILNV
jgi:hypothetical protein